jgi:hypothetical protein
MLVKPFFKKAASVRTFLDVVLETKRHKSRYAILTEVNKNLSSVSQMLIRLLTLSNK